MTREQIIKRVEQAKNKVKRIEAAAVAEESRKDSAWLGAVNDIIDRVALAILDELEEDEI